MKEIVRILLPSNEYKDLRNFAQKHGLTEKELAKRTIKEFAESRYYKDIFDMKISNGLIPIYIPLDCDLFTFVKNLSNLLDVKKERFCKVAVISMLKRLIAYENPLNKVSK